MIDFHSHILYGIDDGAYTIYDSMKLIEEAEKVGFTKIIATSHYQVGDFETDEEKRKSIIEELQHRFNNVEIILGSEVYITQNMIELLEEKKASTINGTKYVLFEIPFLNNTMYFEHVIDDLKRNRYVPIIAHPERYKIVKENPTIVEDWIERGILVQCNYSSIIGKYGKEAQKTIELLLKHKLIHFLGTDAHRPEITYPYINKAKEKFIELAGEEYFKDLSERNAEKVINNENIEYSEMIPIKKNLFGKYR